jgi:sigma-B regulation protein RsbU (phosphoserine phosphatase)
MSLFILLSRSLDNPVSDVHHALARSEFEIVDHVLGSAPTVEFNAVLAAVIDVGERADAAVAQTRRWRAELGDDLVPIVWVVPGHTHGLVARGLDAGADVVLRQPLEGAALTAQLRSAARMRTVGQRVATRAKEARLLGEQLQRAYRQIEREQDAARRIQQAFLPHTLPAVGAARFAVSHRPRSKAGGDVFDVRVLDENTVGFFLGDVVECGSGGSLMGFFTWQSVVMHKFDGGRRQILDPGEVLTQVNRSFLGLGLEERPMVAFLAAILNVQTGELKLARAGLPAPVHVPVEGEPRPWSVPGPFLGTADSSYPAITATLRAGEKMVIGTDGIRREGNPDPRDDSELLAAISRHQRLSGQSFVDAVAQDLLKEIHHADDFTLMCVELKKKD